MNLRILTMASVTFVVSCSGDNTARVARVRGALDQSSTTLADSIGAAEGTRADQEVVNARLAKIVTSAEPSYVVQASFTSTVKEVHVDKAGNVMSVAAIGGAADACPGPTTARDAIAIAERESGGRAFQIQPDDDEPCLFEVQTLAGSKIWEVKLDRNGKVIEKEDATSDDDGD